MRRLPISKEIKELINEIEVSDSDYEKATLRYNSVANFIRESNLKELNPDIFLQGSIKLGTAIKPITNDGAYDIDVVCNFTKRRRNMQSQYALKQNIGEVIKQYASINNMKNKPEDGNRCWTLNYVDDKNFHIDILPAVPWNETNDGKIAITDKRNDHYFSVSNDWEVGNPKGYSEWFIAQSKFREFKEEYAKRFYSKIESIPDYKIKTDLQRIVQLLKRHSEIMFADDMEHKPSSVIITTLAAKGYALCYAISSDFEDLLINVINCLENGLERDIYGRICVLNPVNPDEKLSLKWDRDEVYFTSFLRWLEQVKSDFNTSDKTISSEDRAFYIKRSIIHNSDNISLSLSHLRHHKNPKWEISKNLVDVDITAKYSWNNFRFKRIKSGEVLNKEGTLKFEVKAHNLRQYDIFWQITNTGYEARRANCLRGDFYESDIEEGKRIRKETTAYSGRHYVEAYLVQNGVCYGKSKPFEVNITDGLTFEWLKRNE